MKQATTIILLIAVLLSLLGTVESAACAADAPPARPLQDISGGREIMQCDMNCNERVSYYLYCYHEVGIVYDIYWWVLLACFVSGFIWSIYCYVRVIQLDLATGTYTHWYKPRTTHAVVMFSIIAFLMRLVYFADTYSFKTQDAVFLGVYTNAVLLNGAQALLGGQVMLIVLVWRRVVDSVKYLKTAKHQKPPNVWPTIGIMAVLFFVLIPCRIIGFIVNPMVGTIGTVVAGAIFVGLLIGGFWYSCVIRRLLVTGIPDEGKKAAVKRIQSSLQTILFTSLVAVILIALIALKVSANPYYLLAVNDAITRGIEFVLFMYCTTTVSYKARSQDFSISSANKNASTKHSATNKAGVTPTGSGDKTSQKNPLPAAMRHPSQIESSKQDSNAEHPVTEDQPLNVKDPKKKPSTTVISPLAIERDSSDMYRHEDV